MPRWLWLVLLPAAVTCGESSREQILPAGTPAWSAGAVPLLTIGEVDGDSAHLFSGVAAVRLHSDRAVVVADGGTGTIRLFDREGDLVRQLGGSGPGPGEFVRLTALGLADDGSISAYDAAAHRLTTFDSSGEVTATVPFRTNSGPPEIYIGSTSAGDHLLGWIRHEPRDPSRVTPDVIQIGRFTADGTPAGLVGILDGMRRRDSPLPFSPHLLAAMAGDLAYLTDGLDGTVQVVAPSAEWMRPAFRLDVPVPDAEAAFTLLAEALDEPEAVERLRRIRDEPGSDSIPAFSDLLADDEGHLWLKPYDPRTDSHWLLRPRTGGEWLVVDSAGRMLARARVPEGFRLMDVRGDRLAGVSRDRAGVERIQVYALRRD